MDHDIAYFAQNVNAKSALAGRDHLAAIRSSLYRRGGGTSMKHDASFGLLTGNNVETSTFKAGDIIFREGDNALELFVIKSGQVRIQIGNRTVTELAPDTIFGEMALIDDEPRSATAIAATDVELVPVSEKQFLFLVSQTPYFALKVMRVLATRLRETNKSFG
jgi:CRP/FNR family cyclic AMP-dependent transcriptional regulator